MKREDDADLSRESRSQDGVQIEIDEATVHQEIDGWGASMTESSAYLLMLLKNRDSGAYWTALKRMFGHPEKTKDNMSVNFRIVRIPAGTSDFALSDYTYDDTANDDSLQHFSIDVDKDDIIPVVKDILTINPDILVQMTPWSAPAWMKDSNSLNSGSLRGDKYEVYANYIVKFLGAYEREGIKIHSLGMQNEPMYEPYGYAGMRMTPGNQAGLIKVLAPKLKANGLGHVKVLAFDHNWSDSWFPVQVMQDDDARELFAGSSFHCYGGEPEKQWDVHNVAPEKEIHMTECNGMTNWNYGFEACVTDNMKWYLRSTRAMARSILMWNYVLNWGNGPKNGGCQVCGGLVTVDEGQLPNVWFSSFYYGMGHFSKFMTNGTHRVGTDISDSGNCIDAMAFKNGDGSTHLGVVNSCDDRKIQIRWNDRVLEHTIQKGAMTFAWNLPSQITTTAAPVTTGVRETETEDEPTKDSTSQDTTGDADSESDDSDSEPPSRLTGTPVPSVTGEVDNTGVTNSTGSTNSTSDDGNFEYAPSEDDPAQDSASSLAFSAVLLAAAATFGMLF
jgi:glucosylceramidase